MVITEEKRFAIEEYLKNKVNAFEALSLQEKRDAIKNNPTDIFYDKTNSEELQLLAVQINPEMIRYILMPHDSVVVMAKLLS